MTTNHPSQISWSSVDIYSPELVRTMIETLDERAIVDFTQFPISLYMIDEMIGSLWVVNDIIASGEAYGISREELDLLMQFVDAHNSPDGMMDREWILSHEQKLWLHFYMDIKGLVMATDDDLSSFPDTAEKVAWLVDPHYTAQWEKLKARLATEWLMQK